MLERDTGSERVEYSDRGRRTGPGRGGAVALFASSLLVVVATLADGAASAREPSNLIVLPKDATPRQVLEVMKIITRDLGATCSTCHVTAQSDYATDAYETKRIARQMMQMVAGARAGTLDWLHPPEHLCFECHQGRLRPSR